MEYDETMRLFDAMSEQDQIQFIKQALMQKISNAECWQHCDLKAVYRILRLIGRTQSP